MNHLLVLILGVLTIPLLGQDFQGKALYQTESVLQISFTPSSDADSPTTNQQAQDDLNAQIRKSMQKEYELLFNKEESLYKEVPKLKNIQEEQGVQVVGLGGGTEGGFYKNTQKKEFIESRDVFGKLFLVSDKLQKLEWKLQNETKQIGAYTCYKAIAIKQQERVGMDGNKEIRETEITAWYAPQIPINQGPSEYWGLPGFILELTDNKLHYLCSKISVNPDEEITINAPSKGKEVNQEEFKEIYNKKVLEMTEMYETKRKKVKG